MHRLKKTPIKKEDLDYLSEKSSTSDQSAVKVSDKAKKEESSVDEELRKKLDSLSSETQENIAENPFYFPRCEYKARFKHTSAFDMKNKEYWGTYFRSTSQGGNADRLSKLNDKAYKNSHINDKGTAAKTGAFHSPFYYEEYAKILHTNPPKAITPHNDTVTLSPGLDRKYLYDEVLLYKRKMCENVINFYSKIKSPTSELVLYYKNKYPCIIVSITTDILEKIKSKTEKRGLYKLITAYLVAITNQIAWEKDIPIELVIRSSFGHNLPSVSDTGDTFRINIGLVPSEYTMILADGLKSLWDNFLSPLLKLDDGFILSIDQKTLDSINVGIDGYNNNKKNKYNERKEHYNKNNKYNERKKQKKAVESKKVDTWKENDSILNVLRKTGDSSGRKVVYQLVRKDWYIDLLANLVSKELKLKKPDMAQPLRILLQSLSYKEIVTLEIEDVKLIDSIFEFTKKNMKVKNFKIKDKEFWKIVEVIRVALASNKKLDKRSSAIETNTLLGLFQKLEETNLEFIRNSGYQKIEDEAGSDSDCEGKLTDEGDIVFSRKIIVATGMRAINLSTYVALYQITKYTEVNSYKLLSDSMYYETKKAVHTVLNAFSGFFEVPGVQKSKETKVAEVLFFDLTHCDSTNQESDCSLEGIIDKKQFPVIILDYTSATTAEIRASVEVCFKHTKLVLLVNSGLKNEQAGADMNPYGTLRIVTLGNKDLMIELYSLAYGALTHEKLPVVAHQIRKSYKDAGLTVISAAIYTNTRRAFTDHSAVSLPTIGPKVFDYWNFIEYADEIEKLKLLNYNREEIINLYHEKKNMFLFLGSLDNSSPELLNLIDIKDIEALTSEKLQKLKELIYSFPEELKILLKRFSIETILSWNDEKIRTLSSLDIDDKIDFGQNFGNIENCYDKNPEITKDLITNGGKLEDNFLNNFNKYKTKLKKINTADKKGEYCGNYNIIKLLKEDEAEEGCPEGWDEHSEMSLENEQDNDDGRHCVSWNSDYCNEADESDEGNSDDEYEGFGLGSNKLVGMTQRSIDLNLQLLDSSEPQRAMEVKEFMRTMQPKTRYLIVDSERVNVETTTKLDAVMSLPNVFVMATGVQYDDYYSTKSCADNALLSLAMIKGYNAYTVQLVNPYHLITVIEHTSGQLDDLTQKVTQIANGEYYVPDKGEESWNRYKEVFTGTSQLKLEDSGSRVLVVYDIEKSSTEPTINSSSNIVSYKLYSDLEWYLKQIVYYKEIAQFREILQRNGIDRSIDILLKDNHHDFKKPLLLKVHTDEGGDNEDFIFRF